MDQYCAGDMDLRKLSFVYHHHFGLFWAITFDPVFFFQKALCHPLDLAENTTFSGHVGEIIFLVKFAGQYPPHTYNWLFHIGEKLLPPGCIMEKMSRISSRSGEPEHIRDKRNHPKPRSKNHDGSMYLNMNGFHVLCFFVLIKIYH